MDTADTTVVISFQNTWRIIVAYSRQVAIFPCHFAPYTLPVFFNYEKPADPHKGFFYQQQNQRQDHQRKAQQKANQHSSLRQFIRNRIKNFSQIADHIELPCDKSIHKIGQAGKDQHIACPQVIVLRAVEPDDERNQTQTKKGQDVGDGKYFRVRFLCISFLLRNWTDGGTTES